MKAAFSPAERRLSAVLALALVCAAPALRAQSSIDLHNPPPHTAWRQYGGGPDQSKYMDLKQITKDNVRDLQILWNFADPQNGRYFFNPIVVDGVMYVMGKGSCLVALNAETGKELWSRSVPGMIATGFNYWESADRQDRRLITCARENLIEFNAANGEPITSFGNHGAVSLRDDLAHDLGRDPSTIGREQGTAPGAIYDNLIFLGSSPGENYFSAPGHLRAYDVVTGKMAWIFHTIPQPGEYGYDTWPKDAYKYAGGVNTWGEITVDDKNGIAYFPLGAPTYDYFGADRVGDDLYDECILALDARTGKRLWHFQAVHHGLWDYDLCAAPQLITVQHEGKTVPAVAVAGKNGFLYVFNRLTGEPLWPIVERPVPPSEVPQEVASPTQPFPTAPPPFTRLEVKTNDLNPYMPAAKREQWIKRIAAGRTAKYSPLSDKYETFSMPGAVGGANRGCTAADPDKGIVYIIAAEFSSDYKLTRVAPLGNARPTPPPSAEATNNLRGSLPGGVESELAAAINPGSASEGKAAYDLNCKGCHGAERLGQANIPAVTNVSARFTFPEFQAYLATGKGLMPGFPHIEDQTAADLYVYMGGTMQPAPRGRRGAGARGFGRRGGGGYPIGVTPPTNNYTSSYGMDAPELLSPPWSTLTAYDLNKGIIKWQSPLGQDPNIVPVDGKMTGMGNGSERRGMLVTSTGLVFATCLDGKLYAYDADNGSLIWSTQLPRNTEGIPAMYEVNGREFIVICLVNAVAPKSKATLPIGYVVYGLPLRSAQTQPAAERLIGQR